MNNFKNRYNAMKEEIRKIEGPKYEKYINNDFIKINTPDDLCDVLTMKKGDMYVVNESNIFIYTGSDYYWEKYKVDHKRKILVRLTRTRTELDLQRDYSPNYQFEPSPQLCKQLKEKQKNGCELTKEEQQALDNNWGNNFIFIVLLIIMAILLFI